MHTRSRSVALPTPKRQRLTDVPGGTTQMQEDLAVSVPERVLHSDNDLADPDATGRSDGKDIAAADDVDPVDVAIVDADARVGSSNPDSDAVEADVSLPDNPDGAVNRNGTLPDNPDGAVDGDVILSDIADGATDRDLALSDNADGQGVDPAERDGTDHVLRTTELPIADGADQEVDSRVHCKLQDTAFPVLEQVSAGPVAPPIYEYRDGRFVATTASLSWLQAYAALTAAQGARGNGGTGTGNAVLAVAEQENQPEGVDAVQLNAPLALGGNQGPAPVHAAQPPVVGVPAVIPPPAVAHALPPAATPIAAPPAAFLLPPIVPGAPGAAFGQLPGNALPVPAVVGAPAPAAAAGDALGPGHAPPAAAAAVVGAPGLPQPPPAALGAGGPGVAGVPGPGAPMLPQPVGLALPGAGLPNFGQPVGGVPAVALPNFGQPAAIPVGAVAPALGPAPVVFDANLFDDIDYVPDVIKQRILGISNHSDAAANVFGVAHVPSGADWGRGRMEKFLVLNGSPVVIWFIGRVRTTWFYNFEGQPHTRVNVGATPALCADMDAVDRLYTRARPRSAPATSTIYASRMQTVRERGEKAPAARPFEEVYDASGTFREKTAMTRLSAADVFEDDIIVMECNFTRWRKNNDGKKKHWSTWDVGFELISIATLYSSPNPVTGHGPVAPVQAQPAFAF